MCGIVAVLHFDNKNIDEGLLVRMRDTMYHRGPDDAGIFIDTSVGLAHRRLSIIDLSETGHQPMFNENNTISLIFNGEIYNYVELMEDLKRRGHRFSSSSDTEVIIHQYEEDGEQCLKKFNGMFSFVLWDGRKGRLFAARDRVGIKPLYYYHNHKKILLASEIKAIIEDPSVERMPDHQAIIDYFYAGRSLGDKTMFRNIKEVEPGCMLTADKASKDVSVRKYWDVVYNYNYSRTDKETKEELFALLDDAVKVHCRSDAPLGCHLSGGMDSSTIVALASRYRKNLKTFSIKFSDDAYIDETRYAKAVTRHVGAHYLESSPSAADMARLLPFLVWHMDVPMATDGGFSYFTVSRLAKDHVKVSLTGHGGDEVFAGYPAQFYASYNTTDMFTLHFDPDRVITTSLTKRLMNGLLNKSPMDIYRSIKKRFSRGNPSFEDLWIQLHCSGTPANNSIFHKDFMESVKGYSSRDDYLKPLLNIHTEKTLDKCLYHDLRVYLPGLLHLEDRVSMAVSIESRVPLLDYRIIEFLATVPPEQKIDGMQPKYLLREVASSLLPEEVWKRKDKRPFPVPGRFWQTHEMKDLTEKILLSSDSLDRGIFKSQALRASCSNIDVTWQLINVELWFKIFIDKDPAWIDRI